MNTIDQQIADLEKEKTRLQKQAVEDKKLENFNELKEKYEGKVKCTFSKRKKSNHFFATWYKKVVMKDGDIYVPRENISGMFIYESPKKYQFSHEIITMSSYNCKIEEIKVNDLFSHKKEMSVEQFKILRNCQVSFTESMFLMAEDKEVIKTLLNSYESGLEEAIKKTEFQLDVPHIMLEQREAWLLGASVFLNDLCFLLTFASINHAKTVINAKIKSESQASLLLADYGHRYHNDRTDALYSLLSKLEIAYSNIKK